MQFVPYRLLRNAPGELRRKLEKEGPLIVTSNGEPFALMLEVKPDEVEEVFRLMTQLRAQLALSGIRARAQEQGLDRLSAEEIDAEIQSARREARHAHRP